MSDSGTSHAGSVAARHRTWSRKRWLRLFAGLLVVLVGLGAGAGVLAYWKLDSNLTSERVEDQLDERPAPAPAVPNPTSGEGGVQRPLNLLLIGSDTRAGANVAYGGRIAGERSDVTILLHLSADRKRAVAVHIPRDSLVPIPSCRRRDGTRTEPALDLFNAAFARGGSACVIRTIERLTDIRIDHHIVVDFTGFKRMVDAVGTVPIYMPHDVNVPGLHLRAGVHQADGEKALAYVRNRGFGRGGDLGRIERQQAFLAAMMQKVTSRGILTNPPRLYQFLEAATESVTTDPELASLNELRKLAQSVQKIGLDRVHFLTVPSKRHPTERYRLQWTAQADELWQVIRTDSALPPKMKTKARSAAEDIYS